MPPYNLLTSNPSPAAGQKKYVEKSQFEDKISYELERRNEGCNMMQSDLPPLLLTVAAVLQVSARHVESEGVQGSCTACLLTINTELGRMQAATLGDSGFFLIGREPGKQQVSALGD